MAEYKPDLPPDVKLPAGASINVEHPDFKALTAVARAEGWSQSSFSKVLGLEVARSERGRAAAPAAPAPAPKVDFDKLSTTERFLTRSRRHRSGADMTEHRIAYFRNAAGEVHPVTLPALEAITACHRHPHEWSLAADKFAEPPEGFVASESNGGGIGRVRGAGVRAD